TLDGGEISEEEPGQVDQVNALVDQLAAAGQLLVGAPFAVVADAAAVTVTAAQEHKLASGAATRALQGLQQRRMMAVVEADADADVVAAGDGGDGIQLGGAAGAWFFDKDVLAGFDGTQGNLGQRSVQCRHQNDVHVRPGDGGAPVVGGVGAAHLVGEALG